MRRHIRLIFDDLLFGPAPVLAQEPGSLRRFSKNLLRKNPADLVGRHALLGRAFGIDLPPLRVDICYRLADLCRGARVAHYRKPIELLTDNAGAA